MNWCFGFPFAPNGEHRAAAFKVVQAYYAHHFPGVPQLVHSATKVGEPFLRAATRNQLVEQAAGYDLVCLIDADTLIHPDELRAMLTPQRMRLSKPFRRGVNVPDLNQVTLTRWPRGRFNDPGAAWIIRPEDWWTAGGMDEAFTGWGGEDNAFGYAFAAAGGTTIYGRRPAVKQEHPGTRWANDPMWETTIRRELVYKHIWRHPALLTEWLTVRHLPGVVDEWIDEHSIVVPELRVRHVENVAARRP